MDGKRRLAEVEKLAREDRYQEALALCQSLMANSDMAKDDVLRMRSYVQARSGNHAEAVQDLEEVLKGGHATLKDRYQSADQALKAGKLELARDRFQEVLSEGERENEDWFKSATHFYLAYVELQLRNFDAAMQHVKAAKGIEADCAMPLPNAGLVSADELEGRIGKAMRR